MPEKCLMCWEPIFDNHSDISKLNRYLPSTTNSCFGTYFWMLTSTLQTFTANTDYQPCSPKPKIKFMPIFMVALRTASIRASPNPIPSATLEQRATVVVMTSAQLASTASTTTASMDADATVWPPLVGEASLSILLNVMAVQTTTASQIVGIAVAVVRNLTVLEKG
jgi:hypothetical protein